MEKVQIVKTSAKNASYFGVHFLIFVLSLLSESLEQATSCEPRVRLVAVPSLSPRMCQP